MKAESTAINEDSILGTVTVIVWIALTQFIYSKL